MDSHEIISAVGILFLCSIILMSIVTSYWMGQDTKRRLNEIYLESFLRRYEGQRIYLGFDNHRLCYFNSEHTLCGSQKEWEELHKRPVTLPSSFDGYHAGLCRISLCKKTGKLLP